MKALRHTPAAPSRCASRAARLRHAAVIRAAFACALHPGVDAWSADFERQHHDGDRAVGRTGVERFCRVEDAAVRRIKPGLRDRANRARGSEEILEAHRAARAKLRAILQPHPRLRDDTEKFLPSRSSCGPGSGLRRSPAGGGFPACPLGVTVRTTFDEIVNMRVERGEMAAARASRSSRPA